MREPGSGTRSTFEAALHRLGLSPAVLSASVAASGLEAGLLHHVALPLAERPFRAVWHRERYLGRAARELLARIAGTLPPAQRPSLPAVTAPLHDPERAGGT